MLSQSQSQSQSQSLTLNSYGKQALGAAMVALENSLELRVKTGDLKPGAEMSDEELQRVIEEYENGFLSLNKKLHKTIKLKIAQTVSRTLKPSDHDGQSDGNDEQSEEGGNDGGNKKRPRSVRRPKVDISEFVKEKPHPKRMESDEAFTALVNNLLEHLNAKFPQQNVSFQSKDSPNTPFVKITKTYKEKESVYCLVSKTDFDRKREARPKKSAEGEITSVDTENVSGLTVAKCFNSDKELVTVFKIEHLKKGDVLKPGSTVPAVKGNILSDFNDALAKMSMYGLNGVVDNDFDGNQEHQHEQNDQHEQNQTDQTGTKKLKVDKEQNEEQNDE